MFPRRGSNRRSFQCERKMVASHFRLGGWPLPHEGEVCSVTEVKVTRLFVQKNHILFRTEFNETFSIYTLFHG